MSSFKGVYLGPPLTPSDLSPLSTSTGSLPFILGSTSSTRAMILSSLDIPYTVKVKEIDERSIGKDIRQRGTKEDARELVAMLARAKRDALAPIILSDLSSSENEGGVLLATGDQVVTHEDMGILEKPLTISEASQFMEGYRRVPKVTTVGSFLLTHYPSGIEVCEVFEASVLFHQDLLKKDEEERLGGMRKGLLEELVESGAPVLKCAGGLMVENEIVKNFIKEVQGGEDAVLGLSRKAVLECMEVMDGKLREGVGK
ncbi:hypothetical protein TrCOL_g6648 [Triparma columacea]|uniref:Uncharacterized protein n=1 Tax=Triparma columacea TaxID=722753 RepID=A0A9W7LEU6_9STRA|nr:hypothetical protein TrCOL_g6648 [Triparma columacea]